MICIILIGFRKLIKRFNPKNKILIIDILMEMRAVHVLYLHFS